MPKKLSRKKQQDILLSKIAYGELFPGIILSKFKDFPIVQDVLKTARENARKYKERKEKAKAEAKKQEKRKVQENIQKIVDIGLVKSIAVIKNNINNNKLEKPIGKNIISDMKHERKFSKKHDTGASDYGEYFAQPEQKYNALSGGQLGYNEDGTPTYSQLVKNVYKGTKSKRAALLELYGQELDSADEIKIRNKLISESIWKDANQTFYQPIPKKLNIENNPYTPETIYMSVNITKILANIANLGKSFLFRPFIAAYNKDRNIYERHGGNTALITPDTDIPSAVLQLLRESMDYYGLIVPPPIIGFMCDFVDENFNNTAVPDKRIKGFKAFKICPSLRKFSTFTLRNSGNNRDCIAISYYQMKGLLNTPNNSPRYFTKQLHEEVKELIAQEPELVQKYFKEGSLVKALMELSKKDENKKQRFIIRATDTDFTQNITRKEIRNGKEIETEELIESRVMKIYRGEYTLIPPKIINNKPKQVNLSKLHSRFVFLYSSKYEHVAASTPELLADVRTEDQDTDAFGSTIEQKLKKLSKLSTSLDKKDQQKPYTLMPEDVPKRQWLNKRKQDPYVVFDSETYARLNPYLNMMKQKPFCICALYYDPVDNITFPYTFYNADYHIVVKNFVDFLIDISTPFTGKHEKESIPRINVYGFNNTNFDNQLIFKELCSRNIIPNTSGSNNALKLICFNNIAIMDIHNFYAGSLVSVANAFQIPMTKGYCPYKFLNLERKDSNNETLLDVYYKGQVPKRKYWESKVAFEYTKKQYENKEFDLEKFITHYCLLDCGITLDIVMKHREFCRKSIFIENIDGEIIEIEMDNTRYPTAASLSMAMFKKSGLSGSYQTATDDTISDEDKEEWKKFHQKYFVSGEMGDRLTLMKDNYYGGRTEVFKAYYSTTLHSKIFNEYDINSSYPASMIGNMPLKLVTSRIHNKDASRLTILDHCLYECNVTKTNDIPDFISPLIIKSNDGTMVSPYNHESIVLWGVMVKELIVNDEHKVHIIREDCYSSRDIFSRFINTVYKMKLDANNAGNEVLANFYKLILNSLYGKFGQKDRMKTIYTFDVVSEDARLKNLGCTIMTISHVSRKRKNLDTNTRRLYKISFYPPSSNGGIGSLVRLASYITTKARVNLHSAMRAVGYHNVFYCDTDSIYCTGTLPNYEEVKDRKGKVISVSGFVHPDKLGMFKKENTTPIKKAIFLSKKCKLIVGGNYPVKGKPGIFKNEKITMKGIKVSDMKKEHFYKMLEGQTVERRMMLFVKDLNHIHIKQTARRVRRDPSWMYDSDGNYYRWQTIEAFEKMKKLAKKKSA